MNFLRTFDRFEGMGLWTHDKKPKVLSDVIGNREVCKIFEHYLVAGNIPNIIITGEHGTAKRTIAHIASRTYLGKYYKSACLEIDGAIYRGKDVISLGSGLGSAVGNQGLPTGQSVLGFATNRVGLPPGRQKIIIIYNFDNMTAEAQNALRTIMEKNALTTRFILICNAMGDIIEAIQSRCVQLKTQGLDYDDASGLIESLIPTIDSEIRDLIITLSDGDYKKIINYSQVVNSQHMTVEVFYNLFNIPPIKTIEGILMDIYAGKDVFDTVHTYLVEQGHSYVCIIDTVKTILVFNNIDIPKPVTVVWLSKICSKYADITPCMNSMHIYALFGCLYHSSIFTI